jgi:hypothetical protein
MQRQVNHLRFVYTQNISQTLGRGAGHASCAVLRAITEGDLACCSFHLRLLWGLDIFKISKWSGGVNKASWLKLTCQFRSQKNFAARKEPEKVHGVRLDRAYSV